MESQETMRNISDTTIIEDSVFEQAVATSSEFLTFMKTVLPAISLFGSS